VQLTETVGAYREGEIVEVSTFFAMPLRQEFRKPGSCFRWVNTDYQFVQSPTL
jgi:phosphatidylserine decarboxylase